MKVFIFDFNCFIICFNSAFRKSFFSKGKEMFFKNLVIINDLKMKLRITSKKYMVFQAIKFPQNRFFGLWSSQRSPASLRVRFFYISPYQCILRCRNFHSCTFLRIVKHQSIHPKIRKRLAQLANYTSQ